MSKVVVIFDMAASLADAQALRTAMVADNNKSIMFWADAEPIGGSSSSLSTNTKINALVFGV
jgi:hypothetical protein